MRVIFGVLEQTQGLHQPTKFHLNVFIVSAFDGQKTQFWANFDIFWAPVPTPFLPIRAKFGVLEQTQGLHLQTKFHLNVFIVSASDGAQTLTFKSVTDKQTDKKLNVFGHPGGE